MHGHYCLINEQLQSCNLRNLHVRKSLNRQFNWKLRRTTATYLIASDQLEGHYWSVCLQNTRRRFRNHLAQEACSRFESRNKLAHISYAMRLSRRRCNHMLLFKSEEASQEKVAFSMQSLFNATLLDLVNKHIT